MGWNGSVPHLNVLIQGSIYEMQDINRKTINECKLYGEARGKTRAALAVAVRRCDYNFIAILDKYLDDCQEVLSSNSDSDASSDNEIKASSNISNEKLDSKELTNPYKHKASSQPKRTDKIRHACEPPKKTKRKLHCKICGGTGHNRMTCSRK
ncbi:hypothetical protein C2G38_2027178 [Gigaspora rosea]|uniref:CCHC-type domain-containing protein n=1 Tax=Gigaspora rosea TaxID=44941 RepID=A0A397W9D2_9GLOM|nr:hypothetical protein C2G38_2027178 [Gigaspora rosea]